MLYLHLHVMHRVGWYPRNMTKLVARAVVRERGRRPGVPADHRASGSPTAPWAASASASRWSRCKSSPAAAPRSLSDARRAG